MTMLRRRPARFTQLHMLPIHAAAAGLHLDATNDATLLASIRRLVPPKHLKRGDELFIPRALTGWAPQLSGVVLKDVIDSKSAPPAHVIVDMKDIRGSSLRAIAAGFAERMRARAGAGTGKRRRARANASGAAAAIRLDNPLVALQSAPGGGKSSVLDCAALLSTHGIWHHFCSDATMCAVLSASVPVTVTFNSGSDPDFDHADARSGTGLALRILWSFFTTGMHFSEFAALLKDGCSVSPSTAVKCCLAALPAGGSKKGILLLVDEIVKLEANADAVLSKIGELLNAFTSEQLNAVCTTLNAQAFNTLETHSGRPIAWAPLQSLQQTQVEKLLRRALRLQMLPRPVRIAVGDCGGHPRSLEYLMKAARRLMRAKRSSDEGKLLDDVRHAVVRKLRLKAPTWAVRAALEGRALPLDEPVPSSGSPAVLREHIAAGTFFNTDVGRVKTIVPKMSMMSLMAAFDSGTSLHEAVMALAAVEARAVTEHAMGGNQFEDFTVNWLRLRVLLAAERCATFTLKDVFLGPLEGSASRVGISLPDAPASTPLVAPRAMDIIRTTHTLTDYLATGADLHVREQQSWVRLAGAARARA